HPIHEIACLHKQTVTAFIGQIMPPLSTQVDAEELARQLSLLIDGAMVSAQVSGHKDAAIRARKMAIRLLSSYGAVSDSVMKEEVLG
ncbi:MAG: hypothetical protein R3183_12760, partial [Oleiphilaceae bacterium]|nr:hypothetical protein [Oleiphilaceae bacterium]